MCEREREQDRHVGSINRLLCQHDGTRPATQELNYIEILHLSVHVLQWNEFQQGRLTYSEIQGHRHWAASG